jgi:hypothetical protein
MDSIDAQCLIIGLVGRETPPPCHWHHHRSGELTCAYSEGEREFTWDIDAVAEMGRRWRESTAPQVPEMARPYVDAHRSLDEIVARGGIETADLIVHDFDRHELRAWWEDEKALMVIDEIDVSSAVDLPSAGG